LRGPRGHAQRLIEAVNRRPAKAMVETSTGWPAKS
jgi:hypothetical protein